MAVETDRSWQFQDYTSSFLRLFRPVGRFFANFSKHYRFTSLARRIIFLNALGLTILVAGNLYLNQFRAGLIEAKVKSLETQGRIIAAAIAGSATVKSNSVVIPSDELLELQSGQHRSGIDEELSSLEFTIDPEQVAPVLYHLVQPTGTRARLYGKDGGLIIDTMSPDDRDFAFQVQPPLPTGQNIGSIARAWQRIVAWFLYRDLSLYEEIGNRNGKFYPEVETALAGILTPIVRVNTKGELVISIGVPVKRRGSLRGVLLLSAQGGDIEAILRNESLGIGQFALVAFGVTLLLSGLLAGQIAGPMRRLSGAAEQVRKSIRAREEIPDYTSRPDEIGHLSGALRDMTSALYRRLDSIESFAADVAHELKNPLTSLRSAAETLQLVKKEEDKKRLVDIILHDVGRLERLITDISDASRLDAELALVDAEEVDLEVLLRSIVRLFNEIHMSDRPQVVLEFGPLPRGKHRYMVMGHGTRLGQVFNNILDNALSFSPPEGRVYVKASHFGDEVQIAIEDEGPGIDPEHMEKIFVRFYTDRPGEDQFGRNSGLGLNISRQIVEAHGGRIWAENCSDGVSEGEMKEAKLAAIPYVRKTAERRGARFVIRLPAASSGR